MNNNSQEIIGVVACGGLSLRMRTDKSLIDYHGKPQRYYLYDLMKTFCENVFISCNRIQAENIEDGYKYIVDNDKLAGHGPISGLLSCFKKFPDKSILFIGCDYPNIDSENIKPLIDNRNNSSAVSFVNLENIIEPLITIYENECHKELLNRFAENKFSLREFLENINTKIISPTNPNILKSIDTPEESEKIININFK